MRSPVWPLAGRAEELTVVEGAFREPGVGGVVLSGPPGVGRTRLLREAVERLRAPGRATGWVTATRAAALVPHGAVTHLLPTGGHPWSDGGLWRRTADRLAERTEGRPLVLAVDDAHLLDDGSAGLLHHLTARGLVFAVIGVRTGEPVPDAITALWKDELVWRTEVAPLARAQMDELIAHTLGPHVAAPTAHEIHQVAEGNPLFLRELLADGLRQGVLLCRDGVWCTSGRPRHGARLVELVRARLAGLDGATRAVVETVACGEPLPAAVLTRLTGLGVLLPDAVEAAERDGLIVAERSGRRCRFGLVHPLYGHVIRGTMPESRTRRITGHLVRAAEGVPARRTEDARRLADWQSRTGLPGRPSVLLAGALGAAVEGDFTLSERLARAARDVGAGPPADLALAWAVAGQGRYADARSLPGTPTPTRTALRANALYWGDGDADAALRELDGTLPVTERGGLPLAFPDAARAWILLHDGRCAEALSAATAAQATAPERGVAVELRMTAAVAAAFLGRGMPAFDAIGATPLQTARLDWARCLAAQAAGRIDEARALAEDARAAEAVLCRPRLAAIWAGLRGGTARTQGRTVTARAELREAVALLHGRDVLRYSRWFLAELAGAAALAGDAREAEEWMERADREQVPAHRLFEPRVELNRAWTAAAGGDLARAVKLARHAADLAGEGGQRWTEAYALYDAVRLGAPPGDVLERLRDTAAFARAAAALDRGSGDELDAASATLAALGLPLHAAELATTAARAHQSAGRSTHAHTARERAAALVAATQDARTPLLAAADETEEVLTAREREIALLAASGLASKDIADRLTLSVRTVNNHLGRVYQKIGISRRRDLAGYFDRLLSKHGNGFARD